MRADLGDVRADYQRGREHQAAVDEQGRIEGRRRAADRGNGEDNRAQAEQGEGGVHLDDDNAGDFPRRPRVQTTRRCQGDFLEVYDVQVGGDRVVQAAAVVCLAHRVSVGVG